MMSLIGWLALIYYAVATVLVFFNETGDAIDRAKKALTWPLNLLIYAKEGLRG